MLGHFGFGVASGVGGLVVVIDSSDTNKEGIELSRTYSVDFHPSTKPSRVNSPMDGHLHISKMARQATSSSWTSISPRNLMAPSIPMPSGVSSASSEREGLTG